MVCAPIIYMPLETLFKKLDNEEKKLRLFLEESLKNISVSEKDAASFYLGILKILEEQNNLLRQLREQIEDRMLIHSEENELIRKLIGANESKAKFKAAKFAEQIVALKERLYDQEELEKKCGELKEQKDSLTMMVADIKDKYNKKIQDHFREIEEEKRILQQAFLDVGLRQEKLSREVKAQRETLSVGIEEERKRYFREFFGSVYNMKSGDCKIIGQTTADYIIKTRSELRTMINAVEDNIDLLDLRKLGFTAMSDAGAVRRLKEYFKNIKQAFMFVLQVLKTQQGVAENFKKIAQSMRNLDASSQKHLTLISPAPEELASLDRGQFKDSIENLFFTVCSNREILLNLEVPEDFCSIITDINALRAALVELFKNAEEAIAGSGEIKLSIRLDEAKNIFLLRVSNSGRPIAAGVRSGLFKPFITDKPFKDGLGLVRAKIACQRLGGDIKLEKSDEEATVFALEIPAMMPRNG